MFSDLVLLTVVGDDVYDYELLLGSLEYHLKAGFGRVIWETGPKRPTDLVLPSSVIRIHRPEYGRGMSFDYGRALNDATAWCEANTDAVGVLRLDACEFMARDWRVCDIVRQGQLCRVALLHHVSPGLAIRRVGDSRVMGWPLRTKDLVRHTPGFHPFVDGERDLPRRDLSNVFDLHRVRFAIGPRSDAPPPDYWDTARGVWRVEPVQVAWPEPLLRWRREAVPPSRDFRERVPFEFGDEGGAG